MVPPSDGETVSADPAEAIEERGTELLRLYERAVPEVYGYLVHRCRDAAIAEDLTSEVFLAAVADSVEETADPWDVHLDQVRAAGILSSLAVHHRMALTLRYLDGLPVAEVASLLDRTVHATEALLVRARAAFRRAYSEGGGDDA